MQKLKVGDRLDFCGQMVVVEELAEPYMWADSNTPEVVCSWFNNANEKKTSYFKENCLVPLTITKELQKYPLLFCEKLDCYGFKVYSSLLAGNFHKNENFNDNSEKDTRFVYDFKKYGSHRELITNYLTILKSYFDTQTIVAVPAHTTDINNLQLIVGTVIKRIAESAPRKYNHKLALSKDYANTYQIDFGKLKEKKIILVDDVVTSGETINHFADALQAKGYEVVKFALGIDYKQQAKIINTFYSF
jgi:orotate phosphoribosyltransferase-like protein